MWPGLFYSMITDGWFRLPDRAEWISSCQCDLIKKAPFHISVFIRLCNCYCFSPSPSPGACVCEFFVFWSVFYYKHNLTLLSRVEGSIPRFLQLISSCVRANDSIAALHHWLGSLGELSLGQRDFSRYCNAKDKCVCAESHRATRTLQHIVWATQVKNK